MEWLYVLYALLILAVVASVPLRLKAQRRGREELERLASTLQQRIEELFAKVEAMSGERAVDSRTVLADARLHRSLDVVRLRFKHDSLPKAERSMQSKQYRDGQVTQCLARRLTQCGILPKDAEDVVKRFERFYSTWILGGIHRPATLGITIQQASDLKCTVNLYVICPDGFPEDDDLRKTYKDDLNEELKKDMAQSPISGLSVELDFPFGMPVENYVKWIAEANGHDYIGLLDLTYGIEEVQAIVKRAPSIASKTSQT